MQYQKPRLVRNGNINGVSTAAFAKPASGTNLAGKIAELHTLFDTMENMRKCGSIYFISNMQNCI